MLKGIHLGQVATKEFLDKAIIGVTSISLLTILAPLNKMLCCTKSRLQSFFGSSVVRGELLGTFLSSFLFLANHLIALNFRGITAHRKTEIIAVGLCNGIRIIGRKLVC